MFNVVLIQLLKDGTAARSMTSYDTLEAAKSKAYLELAQVSVSETLKAVNVAVMDDGLSILFFNTNAITEAEPEVELPEEE